MSSPARIQLRRTRGWRMPAGAVRVDRRTKWGNPYRVEQDGSYWWCMIDKENGVPFLSEGAARRQSLLLFREYLDQRSKLVASARSELRGRDVGCWCNLDADCHGDIWLEIANAPLACEAVDVQ